MNSLVDYSQRCFLRQHGVWQGFSPFHPSSILFLRLQVVQLDLDRWYHRYCCCCCCYYYCFLLTARLKQEQLKNEQLWEWNCKNELPCYFFLVWRFSEHLLEIQDHHRYLRIFQDLVEGVVEVGDHHHPWEMFLQLEVAQIEGHLTSWLALAEQQAEPVEEQELLPSKDQVAEEVELEGRQEALEELKELNYFSDVPHFVCSLVA